MKPLAKKIKVKNFKELLSKAPNFWKSILQEKVLHIIGLPVLSKDQFLLFSRACAQGKNDLERFISWDFGHIMELKEDEKANNYLFSQEKVPFHWDGAFLECPSILLFQCLEPAQKGGETLFCDTEEILSYLTEKEKEILKKTKAHYTTEKLAHYGGTMSQQILDTHPITQRPVLRFGEMVTSKLSPVTRHTNNEAAEKILAKLDSFLNNPNFQLVHRWKKGDILLADNHSLLHGRKAIRSSRDAPSRHMRRIQLR